jgi:hypothetical protein
MLATESLRLVTKVVNKASKDDKKYIKFYDNYSKLAEIYQAYNQVNRYMEESYR